jgi:hypothetical protein
VGELLRKMSQGGIYMSHRILAILCTTLLAAGATAAPKLLQNIPLVWKPTDSLGTLGPLNLSGPVISTALHVDLLVDTRNNPSLIAENHENTDRVLPVTTSGDVAAFVTDHVKETLHLGGLNVVDGPGDMTLSGEIRQYFVTETNTYHSELSLVLHLRDAHGKEVWSGAVAGGAERFGRSYKAENYYETLSDAVIRATYNLLSNPGFTDAFQHR